MTGAAVIRQPGHTRRILRSAVLPALAVLMLSPAVGQEQSPEAVPPSLYARTAVDQAVGRGVVHLLQCREEDGAFRIRRGNTKNASAMTALAVLALAAAGHQPADFSEAGQAMRQGLAFILREGRQDRDGYYGNADGSRMYGHGIVTLMLAEMLGMGISEEQDALIRNRLERAVALIVRAQHAGGKMGNEFGGWRYQPNARDSDLSVTVWQVLALRSARNAGLMVSSRAIGDAVSYLKACYRSGRDAAGAPTERVSACSYRPGSNPEFTMAACGLLAFQVCGGYDLPEVQGSADWLMARDPNTRQWFYYGCYYYAQGMNQMGGEYAERARHLLPRVLLPYQQTDGSFRAEHGQERDAGSVYTTSMAVLALSVGYHYMPIYQR